MKKFIVIEIIIAILLSFSAWFVLSHADRQKATPITCSFNEFPLHISGREGHDELMEKEVEDKLGVNDYLLRVYTKQGEPAFQVYVGYFEKQVTGSLIHSPQHCMPGSGWDIIEKKEISITDSKGVAFPANL